MPGEGSQPTKLTNAVAIDAICDRFEAGLRRGESPDIRAALDEIGEAARPALFQQLLGVQQSIAASPPDVSGLLAEYPEFRSEVLNVCASGTEAMLREIQPDQRYRTGEEVARGGMGSIRLADDVALRRKVAIKSMLAGDASTDELARFIEEAQITGQLDHPGIVPIYEIGVDGDGQPFYTMQFVRGRDLQVVLREGDLSLRQLLNVLNRVCDAVAFAHSRGVLHRDLKPANIRIGEYGEVFVMDWGLAKILGGAEGRPAATDTVISIRGEDSTGEFHTLAGSVMGSPQYMSPEQASGTVQYLDERVDVYALGAILYEILTGRPPIKIERGEDIHSVLERIEKGEIVPPDSSDALSKVAMKALATERDHRYPSVSEFQREIDAWLGGFATEAERAGYFRQVTLFLKRNKLASAAAFIIAILLVVASAINLHQRNVAVTALDNYERSEEEKAIQQRDSAPAYFKAALALERQGDFENALTTLEQAIGFDPELDGAGLSLSILLARVGRYDEAQDVARNLALQPSLTETLERIIAEPELNHLSKLAKLAAGAGMVTTGTDILAQSAKRFEVDYAEGLPIWNAKLRQSYPGLSHRSKIVIDPEWGLALTMGEGTREPVTSLEPLRGIPLNYLELDQLNVTSVKPLEGMPLRCAIFRLVPLLSLEGIENCPLEHAAFGGATIIDAKFLRPLVGMELDRLHLGGEKIDTDPLKQIQANSIDLHSNHISSLEFLRSQNHLRELGFKPAVVDGDMTPVLDCKQLENIPFGMSLIHQVLYPVWKALVKEEATDGQRLSAALEQVEELERRAVSPALEPLRETLDLLRFLIERKQGPSTELMRGRALIVHAPGERVFARVFSTLRIAANAPWAIDVRALTFLDVDLASIHSPEENRIAAEMSKLLGGRMTIGAQRSEEEPEWRWSDGSLWNYSRFPPGEDSQAFALKIQGTVILDTGLWMHDHYRYSNGLLIQFPESWLGESK